MVRFIAVQQHGNRFHGIFAGALHTIPVSIRNRQLHFRRPQNMSLIVPHRYLGHGITVQRQHINHFFPLVENQQHDGIGHVVILCISDLFHRAFHIHADYQQCLDILLREILHTIPFDGLGNIAAVRIRLLFEKNSGSQEPETTVNYDCNEKKTNQSEQEPS